MTPDGGANHVISDLFTRHAIDLLRFEANERKKIRRFFKRLEADLAGQVAKSDPTGPARSAYRAARLEKLLEQVRDTIRASYREANQTLRGEMVDLAQVEATFATRALNTAMQVDLATTSLTPARAKALVSGVLVQGAPISDWWSQQAGDTLRRFTNQMRMGMARGDTNAQLVRLVRGGTQSGEPVSGFMDITRRHAEALVRSATQAVAEATKQSVYEDNSDLIQAVVWSSTLDGRTTVICAVRDGLRYSHPDHKPIGHSVPWGSGPGQLHWGCRSASRPETKSWRDLGIDVDELPPGARASMDGEVAADTKFEDWLGGKSRAFQDDSLGPGRAQLWRDGKITFRELVDGNGRELTLEQLRARI